MDLPERKPIRLPDPLYRVRGWPFSITIGTSPRASVFRDIDFGNECIKILQEMRDETGTAVYAYCLMPDHVHLLLGVGPGASLPSFVGRWKSLCAKARRQRTGEGQFWQRSFYDHAIRDDQDILETAKYILQNPVEAGLVKDFREYPLCGSMEFAL
ncbi:MAG TPA: transposase [Thermoanaerobaculia bacterium]|nr:transposase [Thermoanaerobaculia bacterium]